MRAATRRRGAILVACFAAVLAGFAGGPASAGTLDTVTDRGGDVSSLFTLVLVLSGVTVIATGALLAVIVVRFRDHGDDRAPTVVGHEHRLQIGWIAGMAFLFGFLAVLMIRTMHTVSAPADDGALTVEVVGHQWWWEFRYPESGVVTANEIHLPVGRPIELTLTGADVIHSFWVPDLGWKMDAIPGRTTRMAFTVDETGVYDGACTEFCGVQHAWMRIRVFAEPSSQFDAWLDGQRRPAPKPDSAIERNGLRIFLQNSCITCHKIRFSDGSETAGGVGPDLTHVGSRETLGAGVIANTPEQLRAWIADADAIKPHVLMPAFADLTDEELKALVAYLEGLD